MAQRDWYKGFLFTLFGFRRESKPTRVLLVVAIHVLGWCLLFFLPVLLYPVRVDEGRFILRELIEKSLLVGLFYLNYYLLIPRLFEKRKFFRYGLTLFGLFVFFLFQHALVRELVFPGKLQAPPFRPAFGVLPDSAGGYPLPPVNVQKPAGTPFSSQPMLLGIPRDAWPILVNNTSGSFLFILLLGGFIRLAFSFNRSQHEKKALENERLNAELNFLKSQINPHFLFNTLNGIYSLAHARSPKTESAILQLSELLRYVLYDSGVEKVDLNKDVQYLTNYVDLQKMRISSRVRIDYRVEGNLEGLSIAPLLLICFIENAFKHGISYQQTSFINIRIAVFEKTLTLDISNPIAEKNTFASNGIGIKNVSRRLELLYAGNYFLDIRQNEGLHIVHLKLVLSRDKLPGN